MPPFHVILFAALTALPLLGKDFAAERAQVLALGGLHDAPAMIDADGFAADGVMKPIYFDALPSQGKPTKVFAWLGLPETSAKKVPGIVLVHGGGGTAFKEWVARWNAEGFAAISIAVEGQTDARQPANPGERRGGWKQHSWPGPARSGIYHDSAKPLAEQWMYHAVADTILAHSLLRSLPQVNADQIGLMGISWGGVITSTAVGIDSRFAFAIPTYGCGHLGDAGNQYGRSLGNNPSYQQVWDPMQRLARATMPILWFSWPEDAHFPLDCQAASYRAAPGPRMLSLVPKMGHGHGPPWNRPESYAFAKAIVQDGSPWCRQVSSSTGRVVFDSDRPFDRAVLVSTADKGVTGSRIWIESPAKLQREGQQWVASADVPPNTTAWFINLASRQLVASSEYQTVAPPPPHTREPDAMWTYKSVGATDLKLSAFLPADHATSLATFPAIVIFHGGSWSAGEPNWHYPDCTYWARRGMIAVSVDYRLKDRDSVDVPLACVQDAKSAIRFLRSQAKRLKIDPDRIVAAGGSAGGQLAAATATITHPASNHAADDLAVSPKPAAIILYNPWFKCADALNPVKHLSRDLPPVITFIGGKDRGIAVGEMLAVHQAIKKQGTASTLCIGNDGGHGFCNGRNPRNAFYYWSVELADQFLAEHGIITGPAQVNPAAGVDRLQPDAYEVLH